MDLTAGLHDLTTRRRERVPDEVREVPCLAAEDIVDAGLEMGVASVERLVEHVGQSGRVLLRTPAETSAAT